MSSGKWRFSQNYISCFDKTYFNRKFWRVLSAGIYEYIVNIVLYCFDKAEKVYYNKINLYIKGDGAKKTKTDVMFCYFHRFHQA